MLLFISLCFASYVSFLLLSSYLHRPCVSLSSPTNSHLLLLHSLKYFAHALGLLGLQPLVLRSLLLQTHKYGLTTYA